MVFVFLGMMFLYDRWLALLVIGTTSIYVAMRTIAYSLYRRANEEAIVFAAYENSHFLETLRGIASLRVCPGRLGGVAELSQHQADESETQKGKRLAVEIFPILGRPSAAVEPGEGALDNPAFG